MANLHTVENILQILKLSFLAPHGTTYAGPDGLTIARRLQIAQLLRREAFRVTVGGSAPGSGYDFHVANNPTLLIPLFGSMEIELHDGTVHILQHGDLAYAEDCTGKGHISRTGPKGSFIAYIQLPKDKCPAVGATPIEKIFRD